MTLTVSYNAERKQFLIAIPGGAVTPAINDWPGWKRLPGGTYYAPAWPSSVISMTKTVLPLQWDLDAAMKRDSLLSDLHAMRMALKMDDRTFSQLKKEPTERLARLHQRQAVNALRHMGWRALLTDDMGLGKTSTALWAAHDAAVHRLLVICPVSVKFNWQNEIDTTLGDRWQPVVIDGDARERSFQFSQAQSYRMAKNTAIIINYDLLRHLNEDQVSKLREWVKDNMMLLDESHYVKGRDSERTTITQNIATQTAYIIGMTGTPVRNLIDDLFSQVEIIRPGTWTSYHSFAKRHLKVQMVKYGGNKKRKPLPKIVGVTNLDALNAVMNTMQIRRKKEEVLDLPPKIHTYPELQLDGEHLKLYKAMKDFAKIELQKLVEADSTTTIWDPRAKSAVEQAMRCEQIANGFVGGIPDPLMSKVGDALELATKIEGRPNELIFPTSPKAVWIEETIESVLKQGGAPLVFSRFNAPLSWLRLRLVEDNVRVGFLHGGLNASEKHETIDDFQARRSDVLLAQVRIAEGWNATRCQDVIFWTRDWSPAINAQGEDRTHRIGQTGTVNVQVPIVRNTIELMIHRRLLAKQADADQALRTVTIAELIEAL